MANTLQIIIEAKDAASKELAGVAKAAQQMSNQFRDLGKAVTVIGIAITGTLTAMTVQWAKAGDEVAKLADKTGFSTEALSELRYAAQLSNTSLSGLEIAIKRMQVVITESVNATSASAKALNSLGLSYQKLKDLTPEQQFAAISSAIADITDPTLKAALAIDMFGRSGTDMLPMLADGSAGLEAMRKEARDLGIVFDEKTAKAAEAFKDSITRLKGAISGIGAQIAKTLAPIITAFFRTITDVIKGITDWANRHPALARAIAITTGAFGLLLLGCGAFIKLAPFVGMAFHTMLGPVGLVIGAISLIVSGLTALAMRSSPAEKATQNLTEAMDKLKTTLVPKLQDAIQSVKGEYESLIQLFETGQYKTAGFLTEKQIATIRLVDSALADQLETLQRQYEEQQNLISGFDKEARAARTAWIQMRLPDIERQLKVEMLPSERTKVLEEQRDLNKELAELTKEDISTTYTSLLEANKNAIITGLQNQLDTVWQPYFDAIENGFNNIATFIETDWVKRMNEAVATGLIPPDIADEAIGNIKQAVEDYLGQVSKATQPSTVTGTYTPTQPFSTSPSWLVKEWLKNLKPLQSGGIVRQPTLAMVGERGPEAVIPLDQLESRGGNIINNNFGILPGDEVTMRRLARVLKQFQDEDTRRSGFGQLSSGYYFGRGGV